MKIPSFISDNKFMHKSVYNYELDDDKKLEEIFPSTDKYTNKHEKTKANSRGPEKHQKDLIFNLNNEHNPMKQFNFKSKGVSNWMKTVNFNIKFF